MISRETFLENYYNYSILILAFAIPFPIPIYNVALINLSVATVLNWLLLKDLNFKEIYKSKVALLMTVIFFLEVLSLIHTKDMVSGFSVIERNSIFLILPLLLYKANPSDKNFVDKLSLTFVLSCTIIMFFAYAKAFYDYIYFPIEGTYSENLIFHFTYQELAGKVGLHALYLSGYLIFSFFMTIYLLKKERLEKHTTELKFSLLFFFISILLLKSAMLIVVFSMVLYFYFLSRENKKQIVVNVLSGFLAIVCYVVLLLKMRIEVEFDWAIFIAIFIFAFSISFLLSKAIERVNNQKLMIVGYVIFFLFTTIGLIYVYVDTSLIEYIKNNPSNVAYRYWNWKSAMLLIGENWLFGLGVGDVSEAIIGKYREFDFDNGVWWKFNEHNQYLRYWVGSGVLSFTLFMIVIFGLIRKSIFSQNIPFIVLIVTFVMFSVVESTLGRHYGIGFYSFFFLFYDKLEERIKTM